MALLQQCTGKKMKIYWPNSMEAQIVEFMDIFRVLLVECKFVGMEKKP